MDNCKTQSHVQKKSDCLFFSKQFSMRCMIYYIGQGWWALLAHLANTWVGAWHCHPVRERL